MGVRARLTLVYGAVFLAGTALVLVTSWVLVSGHLHRTLTDVAADDATRSLAGSYGLVLAGLALVSAAFGWLVAGRVLRPLQATLERQTALVAAQQQFIANASHELRSPLTVIRTEADVTLADPRASEADLRRMGRIVLEATERTDALLDALLVLASSRRELRGAGTVDLARAARRAVAHAGPEAAEARIDVELEAGPALAPGDDALLERLVVNLVENAVRHNRPGGRVAVRTTSGPEGAVLGVVNDGPRIDPADLGRLTEPFERLDRTGVRSGTGLGLSVVAAVLEAHGGRLQLEARPEGGLDVVVRLPAASVGTGAPAPDSVASR